MRGVWLALVSSCGGAPNLPDAAAVVDAARDTAADVPSIDASPAPAMLAISPQQYDFGTVQIGCAETSVHFTITNFGGLETGLLSTDLAGADPYDFSMLGSCGGQVLAPAASCSIDVWFGQANVGSHTATLEVLDGSNVTTAPLAAIGAAVDALHASPDALAFDAVAVGTVSPIQSITVKTSGCKDPGDIAAVITGPDTHAFQFETDDCIDVQPNGSCSIGISLVPGHRGTQSATLTVRQAGASAVVALSGSAL